MMRPFIPYTLLLALHLAFILAGNQQGAEITKPLLLSSLLITACLLVKKNSRLKWWLAAGLFFSLLGDVLLIFQQQASIFFMLGLVAFLLAHVCYMVLFINIRKQKPVRKGFNKIAFIIVASYTGVLLGILFPKLGSMTGPVIVYALVIGAMLLAAIHAVYNNGVKWVGVLGAALFVMSDSLLAINKFHTPFQQANWSIMLTYGLAQLFIVYWAVKAIKE